MGGRQSSRRAAGERRESGRQAGRLGAHPCLGRQLLASRHHVARSRQFGASVEASKCGGREPETAAAGNERASHVAPRGAASDKACTSTSLCLHLEMSAVQEGELEEALRQGDAPEPRRAAAADEAAAPPEAEVPPRQASQEEPCLQPLSHSPPSAKVLCCPTPTDLPQPTARCTRGGGRVP